jgi:farnesyl-diphosphate farnesyltransferase
MKDESRLQASFAMDILAATSRTFFIPITQLVPGVQEAVAAAYLCMRAIDEIEDHPSLSAQVKAELLFTVSRTLRSPYEPEVLELALSEYKSVLPTVTLCINDWVRYSPPSIAPHIREATADMAERMAGWVQRGWNITTEEDLDDYTYAVAGAVGELLTDIWRWHDDIPSDRVKAVAFGRGLQAVNILRNRIEDGERGVAYFPDGWQEQDMVAYARRNLALAVEYTSELPPGPIMNFCKIPLALAHGTVEAIVGGDTQLNRMKVLEIVKQVLENDDAWFLPTKV